MILVKAMIRSWLWTPANPEPNSSMVFYDILPYFLPSNCMDPSFTAALTTVTTLNKRTPRLHFGPSATSVQITNGRQHLCRVQSTLKKPQLTLSQELRRSRHGSNLKWGTNREQHRSFAFRYAFQLWGPEAKQHSHSDKYVVANSWT